MKCLADEVHVINLPTRTDRRERISELFKREEIAFRFTDGVRVSRDQVLDCEFCEVRWGPGKSNRGHDAYVCAMTGCKRAHIASLQHAISAGLESLLIFEDDVAFRDGWYEKLALSTSELPEGWLQLYLSANNFVGATTQISKNLRRLGGAWHTTAILYSRDGIEAAHNCLLHARMEIDDWMAFHLHPFGGSYLVDPSITFQTGGFSDLVGGYKEPSA